MFAHEATVLCPSITPTQAHASGAPSQHQTPPSQQQQLSVSLGLTILSALCRLPAVCSSPELLQLLPACVLVAVAGGVGAALQPPPSTSHTTHTPPAVDSDPAQTQRAETESVADALECLVAVAGSRSDSACMPSLHDAEERISCGARAVLEVGGLQAAVAVATAAVAATLTTAKAAAVSSQSSTPAAQASSSVGGGEAAVSQRVSLLALQLAGSLLQPVGSGALDSDLRGEVIAGEA